MGEQQIQNVADRTPDATGKGAGSVPAAVRKAEERAAAAAREAEEKQAAETREVAERNAAEVKRPFFLAVGDLAVAARAAADSDRMIEEAKVQAAKLVADAEALAEQHERAWREAYVAAVAAGWTPGELAAHPLNQPAPPGVTKRGRPRATKKSGTGALSPAAGSDPLSEVGSRVSAA